MAKPGREPTSPPGSQSLELFGAATRLWFERSFELSLTAVGLAASVIGLAELIGEALTASISDRLGLKRAILTGSILASLSYLLLPLIGQTLPLALLALFVLFLIFEFTIVTALSLATEILPNARATMMSSLQAAASLGRVSGAIMGGLIWFGGGLLGVTLASAIITGLGLVCLWWGLRRWRL